MKKNNCVLGNLFLFSLSFAFMFPFMNQGISLNLAGYSVPIIIAAFSIIFIILFQQKTTNTNGLKLILIWYICCLLSSTITILRGHTWESGQTVTYLLWAAILFGILQITPMLNKSHKTIMTNSIIIGGTCIAVLILILRVRYYTNDPTRITFPLVNSEKVDPNYAGSYMATAFLVALGEFLYNSKKFRYVLYMLILFIGIIMTGSRGALVYCGIGIVGAVYEYIRLYRKRKGFIIILLLSPFLLICSLFFIEKYLPNTFNRFFIKITDYVYDGSNLLRLQHYKTGLETIMEAPLLGHGVADEIQIVYRVLGRKEISHNTWMDLYIKLGIPGLVSMISLLIYPAVGLIKRKRYFYFGMIIGLFVNTFILSSQMSYILWMPLIAVWFLNQYYKRIEENNASVNICYSTNL